jgi:anti-sigma-K factor RskA
MKESPDMNENISNERIDELLNGYIDNELTAEQQAEVEHLIEQDTKIAQRLRQLQKCQILVSSMPYAEAPAGVFEAVKASLADRTLPGGSQAAYEEQAGKKYVRIRKVLAAAAMVALAAVLSAVLDRDVLHRNAPERPVAIKISNPAAHTVADSGFSGRLELKTRSLKAVDAFIKSAIDDNGLSASVSPERPQARRIYSLNCSKQDLNSLLTDLDNIWSDIDSATLFVNTQEFGSPTVVENVTTKQISEIAGQDNPEKRIELAKDIAVSNSIAEHLPDKEIRVAIGAGNSNLTKEYRILTPVLTGNQKAAKKPANQAKEKQTVHLTIILDW